MTQEERICLPEGFERKMQRLLGAEYEAFMQSYENERVQGLRFNTLKGELGTLKGRCQESFGLRQVPWCRDGFYYDSEMRPGKHPYHDAGMYYIQEPSAMAAVSLLGIIPGEFVLDLCAAPGGKTSHAAAQLGGTGLLVSNEIHPLRAKALSQNVERMGIPNGVVTSEDSARLKEVFGEFFDRIIVDAPCSGEGMFRKDEQAKREWSEKNVMLCAERQQKILHNAAEMLKPGGRLVYSTCTFSPEENEEQIAGFLSSHPEFSVVVLTGQERLPGLSEGFFPLPETFRIWPHRSEGEGHYLALLEKGGEGGMQRRQTSEKFWKDRACIKVIRECLKALLSEDCYNQWEQEGMFDRLTAFGDQIYSVPKGMPALGGLRVLRPGLHLGSLKKNRFEPSHALALSLSPEKVRSRASFLPCSEEIRLYLTGNPLRSDMQQTGWTLICVDGYSIGWAKSSGGLLKNHYPKGLRIPC